MNTSPSTFDPQSAISKHSARAKQARGVAALAGCFIVMILIILGVANIVQAQSASDSRMVADANPTVASTSVTGDEAASTAVRLPISSTAWRDNIGKQSAAALQMSSPSAKAQTLQNLIMLADRYGSALDLSGAVPMVLHVYAWDRDERLRTMAVAALHAIGDGEGMERMLERFAELHFRRGLSPRLQHITHATLAEYVQSQER
jgi:hypothetical protein